MKTAISAASFLALAGLALAGTIDVGGKKLELPAPVGFTLVSPEHGGLHAFASSMSDPTNRDLGFYVSTEVASAAQRGEVPDFTRYFAAKVNRQVESVTISTDQFAELTSTVREENARIAQSAKEQVDAAMAAAGRELSDTFDVEMALSVSEIVPLDPHHATKHALAYSMYVNYGATVEGEEEEAIASVVTSTLVNVSGRVLYLYAYGTRDELEWTQNASRAWADAVLAANPPPPEGGSSGGIDWGRVLRKAAIFGAIGAVGALVFGKKKKDAPIRRSRSRTRLRKDDDQDGPGATT